MPAKKTNKLPTELTVLVAKEGEQYEVKIDLTKPAPAEVRSSYEVGGKVFEYIPNGVVAQIVQHFVNNKEFNFEYEKSDVDIVEATKRTITKKYWDKNTRQYKETNVTYEGYIVKATYEIGILGKKLFGSLVMFIPAASMLTSKGSGFIAQAIVRRNVLKDLFNFFRIDLEGTEDISEAEVNPEVIQDKITIKDEQPKEVNKYEKIISDLANDVKLDINLLKELRDGRLYEYLTSASTDKEFKQRIQAAKTKIEQYLGDGTISVDKETAEKIKTLMLSLLEV